MHCSDTPNGVRGSQLELRDLCKFVLIAILFFFFHAIIATFPGPPTTVGYIAKIQMQHQSVMRLSSASVRRTIGSARLIHTDSDGQVQRGEKVPLLSCLDNVGEDGCGACKASKSDVRACFIMEVLNLEDDAEIQNLFYVASTFVHFQTE